VRSGGINGTSDRLQVDVARCLILTKVNDGVRFVALP